MVLVGTNWKWEELKLSQAYIWWIYIYINILYAWDVHKVIRWRSMSLEQEKDMYWQSHCARRKQHWGNNLFFYPSFFCWFTTQIFLPSSPSLSLWTLTFLHHQACLPVPPLPLSLSLSLLVFFSFQTNKFLTNWCRYLYHILSIYI